MSLPSCDKDIYENGETIFLTNTIHSTDMEAWIVKVREKCGQKVDWFMFGGRPVVKALGNIHSVRKAMVELKKMHDDGYKKAIGELLRGNSLEDLEDMAWGIWMYNIREYGFDSYLCLKCRGVCVPGNH